MKTIQFILAAAVLVLLFNLAPTPHFIGGTKVIVEPTEGFKYAYEDGSFAWGWVAGCIPWMPCAINEPTDWYIVFYH